jgi:hypothetical protein
MSEPSTAISSPGLATRALNPGATAPQVHEVQWWAIFEKDGELLLYCLNLSSSQTGTTVVHELLKMYNSIKPTKHWWHARATIQEVTIADVSSLSKLPLDRYARSLTSDQFCVGDLEAQDYPRSVTVTGRTPRPDLTEAFHNPNVLRGAKNFLDQNEQFNITPGSVRDIASRRAVLIEHEVNKYVLTWVIGLVVLVAVVAGVVVGVLVHSLGVAMATCAGVIGIFGFIQAFLFGMYK